MNPLLDTAAGSVTLGWILGAMTVVFLGGFLFWVWWAWARRNKSRWEADSRLPFDDGGES